MKILVSDKLGKGGMKLLQDEKKVSIDEKTKLSPEELKKVIGEYDAIVIRSGTKLKADILEAADNLKVIGRAGVGVDNVDLDAATKKGIIVMNTPGGNTVSTCEHTISMLLACARNIPQAAASLKGKKWDRKAFMGTEVFDKVLGIIGFGRIGKEVAKRANSFGMKVLAYDPFISKDAATHVDAQYSTLEDLLKQADFITVHTPLTDETKHMISTEQFKNMKDGVRIINCARGGIIDEEALYEAIKSGKVKGAALDVYEKEPPLESPLIDLDNVIATPHLGASTAEAQENVALDVARQVLDALLDRGIKNAVNMPSLDKETMKVLKPWITLSEKMGLMHTQLYEGSIQEVKITYTGEMTNYTLAPLTISVLKGLLTPICGEAVNFVNAQAYAKERGIVINENKTTEIGDFANCITVDVKCKEGENTITGTLFANNDPRVVKLNDFYVDAVPRGTMLVITNDDKPGVVGEVGTILGKNGVNIAEMTLGRKDEGTYALTVINVDGEIPSKVIEEIKNLSKIIDVNVLKL